MDKEEHLPPHHAKTALFQFKECNITQEYFEANYSMNNNSNITLNISLQNLKVAPGGLYGHIQFVCLSTIQKWFALIFVYLFIYFFIYSKALVFSSDLLTNI